MSTPRAAWLLVRLRLLRLLNLAGMGLHRRRKGASRAATAPKRGGATLGTLVALGMLSYGVVFSVVVVHSVRNADAVETTRVFSLIVALVSLAAFLMSLGTKELAAPEWDMEWLATLPLQLGSLLVVRVVERALIVPVGWMLLWPLLSVLAWRNGAGFSAPLWGVGAALPILLAIGAARALVDTGLRLRVGPARLRNLQALISVVGLAVFYLAIAAGLPGNSFVLDGLRKLSVDLGWSPAGCAVRVVSLPSALARLAAGGVLVLESAVIAGAALALLRHWLRHGVVAGGARESGGRGPAVARPAPSGRRWLNPVHARELKLLGRDRNFLVQTMVLPALFVGVQFLFNRALVESFGQNLQRLGALSFGGAAYTLMFSAFQTLNAEGGALWVLWCVPTSLEAVLRQKARLWGLLALAYPLVLMGIGLSLRGSAPPEALWIGAIVLAGVPIYAVVATCLGVFGCNPLSQDVQRRIKPAFAYSFFLLASVYTYAIYARTVWEQLACMTLSALMAAALWQKARDRLPYLLDPTASPPPRVSLADGMVAALLFFVLQALLAIAIAKQWSEGRHWPGQLIAVCYALAGVATAGLMGLIFWRQKARGVPRLFGPRPLRAVALGVLAGLVAAAFGSAYLFAVADTELFRDAVKTQMDLGPEVATWVAALAVLAAPPVEEFIFRGLIFNGLRRSLPLLPSMLASAAIFAVVHPPVAGAPVFVLGLCTAFVFERGGGLLAPMLAHAVYNGAMLAMPLAHVT